jgi:hypothetical protein
LGCLEVRGLILEVGRGWNFDRIIGFLGWMGEMGDIGDMILISTR